MDLDELKKAWQSQSTRLERLEEQNRKLRRSVSENKLSTKRSKLLRTYTALIVVSVVMIPFVLVSFPELGLDKMFVAMFTVMFAAMSLANAYVYMLVKGIDPTQVSLREALRRVLHLETMRRRIRWVSMSLGAIVIALFFWELYNQDAHAGFLGGVVGGVVGGLVGLRKEAEIKATIRAMKADLEDALQDE